MGCSNDYLGFANPNKGFLASEHMISRAWRVNHAMRQNYNADQYDKQILISATFPNCGKHIIRFWNVEDSKVKSR